MGLTRIYIEQVRYLFPDILPENIITDGSEVLGSFIGTAETTERFAREKIAEWEKEINTLAGIAASDPQLAYSAYIYGTSRRWQFVTRTTPGEARAMKGLEELIRFKLIPAILVGHEVSNEMQKMLQRPRG